MRFDRLFRLVLSGVLLAASAGARAEPADAPALETDRDKALYAIGATMGQRLIGFDLGPEEFDRVAAGLRDAALSRDIRASAFEYHEEIKAIQEERRERAVNAETRRNREFLEGAERGEGVVRTESGLLFQSLEAGSGASPGPRDRVKVHYEGRLRNGDLFDSTRVRGTAAVFPLDSVIGCWTEGLQLMRTGGRARIVCPAALGYGDSGFPPNIPPRAPLDFEVRLLEVEP